MNRYALGVLLDLSKAFESLDCQNLLNNLRFYGCCNADLLWFKDDFSRRKQTVSLSNVTCTFLPVDIGVAQGNIIGPLIFIMFMNGSTKVSSVLKFVKYAGDETIMVSTNTICATYLAIDTESTHFEKLLKLSRLTLNATNTKYTLFHREEKTAPQHYFYKSMSGENVAKVDDTRFLGVYNNKHTKRKAHVNCIFNLHKGNIWFKVFFYMIFI